MVATAHASDLMTPRSRPLILYADPDRVSSLIATRILERMQCDVECVADAAAALEVLQQQRVDLVLCEATMPDLPAAGFITAAHRLYSPQVLPIVVVAVDLSPRGRVEVLRAGAAECLAKPLEAEELRLRVGRLLAAKAPAPEPRGEVALSGALEHLSLPDVLTMLELAKITGRLEVATRRLAGVVELSAGRIQHAALGSEVGLAALADLLRLGEGWFRVRPQKPTTPPTLHGSTTQLLLQASVEQAHRRRSASRPTLLEELGVSQARADAPRPNIARRAARLLPLLSDPHRLGELEIATGAVAAPEAPLAITLFGDASEMVTALWEISAPLSPRTLLDAARPGSTLRWIFFGRDLDRLVVSLVGLDEPSPSWFDRPSDAVIIAVPNSGAHAIDPAVRAYVQSHQMPTVVVADPTEGHRLLSPAPFSSVHVTGTRLPHLTGGLRAVLVAALRLRSQP